jgi:RNA polymerase sigma-70 factor (ECF subfamily)
MSPSERTDNELMETFYACETAAFVTLAERWQRPLYVFLRRRGCSHETAEDLVQDVLSRIFLTKERGTGRFDPSQQFRPWVYRVARNRHTDHHRQEVETHPLLGEVPAGPPSPTVAEVEMDHELHECLEQLSEQERDFLLLWKDAFGTLSQTEVAEALGVSDPRVSRIKQSALDKLRRCMEQKGYH